MEVLILLVVAVVIVLLVLHSKRHPDSSIEPTIQPKSDLKPRLETSYPQVVQQSPRFDAESAIPEPTEKVLEGSAYVVDGDTIKIKKHKCACLV